MDVFGTAVLSETAQSMTLSDVIANITETVSSLLSLITSNWLLVFLLLAPFVIGLLIALIHSLRG